MRIWLWRRRWSMSDKPMLQPSEKDPPFRTKGIAFIAGETVCVGCYLVFTRENQSQMTCPRCGCVLTKTLTDQVFSLHPVAKVFDKVVKGLISIATVALLVAVSWLTVFSSPDSILFSAFCWTLFAAFQLLLSVILWLFATEILTKRKYKIPALLWTIVWLFVLRLTFDGIGEAAVPSVLCTIGMVLFVLSGLLLFVGRCTVQRHKRIQVAKNRPPDTHN